MPGDIPDWALAEIAGGSRLVATQLTAVGLAEPAETGTADVRYRVHALTRAFVRIREPATPDIAALSRLRTGWLLRSERAAAYMPAVPFLRASPPAAETSWPHPDDRELGAEWLDREQANLLTAAEMASSAGAGQDAVALAQRISARLCIHGDYSQAIRVWRALAADAADTADEGAAATANYHLAVVLAGSHDAVDEAAELLAGCAPVLESSGDLDTAALGCCLQGRLASADQRHGAAIRLARHAMGLVAGLPSEGLVQCLAQSVLGVTLARIGACAIAVRHCQQARSAARRLGEPVYDAHAAMTLAQALILSGDSDQAADVCGEGISVAGGYGSAVDVARFGLVLGRARQCGADYEAAVCALEPAATTFQLAGLVLDELTARSLLAACCFSVGDKAAARAQSELVSRLLTRRAGSDAADNPAIADFACTLAAPASVAGWPHRLIAS
jgi:hypothetical protein